MNDGYRMADRHEIYVHRNSAWPGCRCAICTWATGTTPSVRQQQHVPQDNGVRNAAACSRWCRWAACRRRRGDAQADATLDEALALARINNVCGTWRGYGLRAPKQRSCAVTWTRSAREAEHTLPLADRLRHPWFTGELAYWMRRAGGAQARFKCAETSALQLAGQWREAADAWAVAEVPVRACTRAVGRQCRCAA